MALGRKLIDFAFRDDGRSIAEDLQHLQAAIFHHQLERPAEQEIADKHRRRIAVNDIGGCLAPPQVRPVNHIVVKQGRGVNELHRCGQLVMASALIAAQLRPGDRQHRAHALAAAGNQMTGQSRDQRDLALHLVKDYGIDVVHARCCQGKHGRQRRL